MADSDPHTPVATTSGDTHDEVQCPLCGGLMLVREDARYRGYLRLFDCMDCHAELKQVLVRKPKAHVHAPNELVQSSCADCGSSDLHCFNCDDAICDKHVRTVTRYEKYMTTELAQNLATQFGGQVFCPLCFQNVINRTKFDMAGSHKSPKPPLFNRNMLFGLAFALIVILGGLRACPEAQRFSNQPQEEPATQGP